MDIERVNEHTLKLFITYRDIEDRGYSREEIWYNRAKGEELFWDVMTEVNTEDYFELEGPIWIHINASEVGLEVIVTRATFNPDSDMSEMFQSMDEQMERSLVPEMDEAISEALDKEIEENVQLNSRFIFKDIDELIPVAKRLANRQLNSSLYQFENKYYLYVDYENLNDDSRDINAIIKEYLQPSKVTIHRLQEYGQLIMNQNCFETVVQFFE
jgi:adapter protein MecA 1/2